MELKSAVELAPDDVRRQLERIFASDMFRTSKRSSAFLEFVVDGALTGRGAELREKLIGVEVFQRHPGYDSNEDPVVRATAGEVRKRLAQYYQDPLHATEPRIELKPGSYVPEFRKPAAPSLEEPVFEPQPEIPAAPVPVRRRSLSTQW